MLLAGSTRFLSFCFRTLTLTHSARPFFVRRTDERTSEEKEQEKHEGFSRFFFVCGDLRRCKLSFKRIHAHEASGAVSEHRTQRANSFCLLFVSFFPSINRRAVKAAIGRKAKAYFASRRASCFFFFCYSLWAAGRFGAGPRRRSSDKSHSTFWRSARTFAFTRSSIYLSQLFLRTEKEEREEEEQVVTISSQILIQ